MDWKIIAALGFVFAVLSGSPVFSQEAAPPVFRSESTVVVVPTLVVSETGGVVYGLTADEFLIRDNGAIQDPYLDETPDSRPVSLVVAVQTGRHAADVFGGMCLPPRKRNSSSADILGGGAPSGARGGSPFDFQSPLCLTGLRGIGLLLETFLKNEKSEMAVVTFGNAPKLHVPFTSNIDSLGDDLRNLRPGDNGNAILDAVSFSLQLLQQRPADHRRILVLISEYRDHGSTTIGHENVARKLTAANVETYCVAFSADKADLMRILSQNSGLILGNLRSMGGGPGGGGPGGGGRPGGGGAQGGGPPAGGGMGGMGGGMGAGGMGGMGGMGGGMSGGSMGGGGMNGGAMGNGGASGMGGAPGGGGGPGGGMGGRPDLLSSAVPFFRSVSDIMQQNIPLGIAELAGGEYILFNNLQSFEQALSMLSNHVHNRYQLSFQTKNPAPGLHKIEVSLKGGIGGFIAARKGYWIDPPPEAAKESPAAENTAKEKTTAPAQDSHPSGADSSGTMNAKPSPPQ